MVYFVITLLSGMLGGVLAQQFFNEYSLGLVGNLVTGFLGGAAVYVITWFALGGEAYSVAIVGGILGGIIARAGFAVIRQRMVK